ncbi:hypothetical protein GGP80_003178 [Salinibacter ruber]|uniref:DUF4258 domain-containing protein n=1 Tax=Salinibacter ruber TaxID=146919 RepID=UPI0020735507|nr:DUF4258 domain-containing protein [Salinibacter ruber]MCS3937169.1 hypothetical protein [Salinibacter ruber]MCS4099944.1 hypothetical protein [Salinibacter ruber]
MPYLDNIAYTTHAVQKMDQRGMVKEMIENALANGEMIEEYETSEEARYLIHWKRGLGQLVKHIHVVAADQALGRTVVITAYDPRSQADRWSDDFKTRID